VYFSFIIPKVLLKYHTGHSSDNATGDVTADQYHKYKAGFLAKVLLIDFSDEDHGFKLTEICYFTCYNRKM
jgi:hypothetical protein